MICFSLQAHSGANKGKASKKDYGCCSGCNFERSVLQCIEWLICFLWRLCFLLSCFLLLSDGLLRYKDSTFLWTVIPLFFLLWYFFYACTGQLQHGMDLHDNAIRNVLATRVIGVLPQAAAPLWLFKKRARYELLSESFFCYWEIVPFKNALNAFLSRHTPTPLSNCRRSNPSSYHFALILPRMSVCGRNYGKRVRYLFSGPNLLTHCRWILNNINKMKNI